MRYQDRIRLDRYAIKDPDAKIKEGDLVVAAVSFQSLSSGEEREAREIGVVEAVQTSDDQLLHTIRVDDELLTKIPRHKLEYVVEKTYSDICQRVSKAVSKNEPKDSTFRAEVFDALINDELVPAGRIQAGIGREDQDVTLFNCFIFQITEDSRWGITKHWGRIFDTFSRGGGVGWDLSILRPRGALVRKVNGRSSGVISWAEQFSQITGAVEQGGCFSSETRIATNHGLVYAHELADLIETGDIVFTKTHRGWRRIVRAFRNGIKNLKRVTTERGYEVLITPEHKLGCFQEGQISTIPLHEFSIGDETLISVATAQKDKFDYNSDSHPKLHEVVYNKSIMSTKLNENVKLPSSMTTDLAYFIGYTWGNGSVIHGKKVTWEANKGISLSVPEIRPEIVEVLLTCIKNSFDLQPEICPGDGACVDIGVYSRILVNWLEHNNLLKPKSVDIKVPAIIFKSDSKIRGAFISGYFDADGCDRESGGYGFDSVSKEMLKGLQIILADFGIFSRLATQKRSNPNWRDIHRLNVTGGAFKKRMSYFMWMSCKDKQQLNARNDRTSYPIEVFRTRKPLSKYYAGTVCHSSIRVSYSAMGRVMLRLKNGGEADLVEEYNQILNVIPDKIVSIEDGGKGEVFDFEVEDAHMLTGNGFYTSNSRRGSSLQGLQCWHPDIIEFIGAKAERETFEVDGIQVSRNKNILKNSNVSVMINNAFMEAVQKDENWELVFPDTDDPEYNEVWQGDLKDWIARGKRVEVYQTIKAKQLWNIIIERAWGSGEPGLLFLDRANEMSNSWYYAPLICTNPCAEIWGPSNSLCNLTHLNLPKFIRSEAERFPAIQATASEAFNKIDTQRLKAAVRLGVRFLDNVTDLNKYHDPDMEQRQKEERRIGLGILGYGELLIQLGLRYGSDEALLFTEKLFSLLSQTTYTASSDLAVERGSFPMFEAAKFLQSGFMKQALQLWDDHGMEARICEQGMRNVTVNTIAPTGCVAADTLITTNTGMQPIVSMGDLQGATWQDIDFTVCTDTTPKKATNFFANGRVEARELTTECGYRVTPSLPHRLRVIDPDGNYVWKHVGDIQHGDLMVLKKGSLLNTVIHPVHLTGEERKVNSLSAEDPKVITEEFAELLGLYMGDGYLKDRCGVHIVVNAEDADLQQHVKQLLKHLWGTHRNVVVERRQGCCILNLNGRYIPKFFRKNNLAKPKGNHGEGSAGAFIPEKVLRAGSNCLRAFLRGLFEADGSILKSDITLSSTSETLVLQVQQALLALNIISKVRCYPRSTNSNNFGSRPIFILRILNTRESKKFGKTIGFISKRKKDKLQYIGNICDRGDVVKHDILIKEFYEKSKGLPFDARQTICHRQHSGKKKCLSLTQQFIMQQGNKHEQLKTSRAFQLVQMGVFLDPVVRIEQTECDTYDLTVPNGHAYIANGFVSHNSVGTLVDTSTGIEPFFDLEWVSETRIGVVHEQASVVEPLTQKFGEDHSKWPSYVVTAQDITPEDHILSQGIIQRYTDASISKTVNLPEAATIEDVSAAYALLWQQGCKGGTVYRSGSRDEQVLYTAQDAAEKTGVIEVVDEPTFDVVKPRLDYGMGAVFSENSPTGTIHVTIRHSPASGDPEDIFITCGKGDIDAHAQALGRIISLHLRSELKGNVLQQTKLENIRDQLEDIPGRMQYGIGPQAIVSMPDAVGKVIRKYLAGDFPNSNLPFGEQQLRDLLSQIPTEGDFDKEALLHQFLNHKNSSSIGLVLNSKDEKEQLLIEEEEKGIRLHYDICSNCGNNAYIKLPGKCGYCRICGEESC